MFWMLFTIILSIVTATAIGVAVYALLEEYRQMAQQIKEDEEQIDELKRTIMSLV
jgi:hypothetical protein